MFERRQYQEDDVNYAMDHGADLRPIHCAPTGSGKSLCQAMIAKREMDRGNRTAILTPRAEIFGQTHSTLNEIVGLGNVGTLKSGEYWRRDKPVHIVSWPTLTTRTKRSEAWYPDVERLIVDEVHLAMAPKILECLEYYRARGTVIDGYTATPARKSGKGLGDFFTNIKHVTTVRQLIADGKLCPLEYWWGKSADASGMRKTAGDFNSKDVSQANIPLVGDVLDNWGRLASDRHTMVFAADIPHCEALTERFQQAGIKAASLHHKKTPERRAEIDRQFKARQIQVLVNVAIGSYGYDAPSVDCIVMARQTQSIVFHLQALGRGMRTYPDKAVCMVLDHAGNVKRLGQADDLFRWRLDSGRPASANWSRDKRSKDAKQGDDKVYDCENCKHMFSRSRICPKCGWEVPMPKRDLEYIEADLVRMSRQQAESKAKEWEDDCTFYLMLRAYAEAHGYKPGFAFHKFQEKTKKLPAKSWDTLETIPPSIRVANWIRSRQIAFAKAKKRRAA